MTPTAAHTMGCMQPSGVLPFFSALGIGERAALMAFADQALQPPPPEMVRWYCGAQALGLLTPIRAAWLVQHLPACQVLDSALVWDAAQWSAAQRSSVLQATLLAAREQGLLTGWRNERFSFWEAGCTNPDPAREALLQVERAGFRFLGMLSHAVHVNGFLPDGRVWCGQRALSKATDPGMLDNITAGGLPAGEGVHDCLQRELAEEAGLHALQGVVVQAAGTVRTARLEPQGWHDEILHVYNLTLQSHFTPVNQDGEVAAFHCLQAQEVLAAIQRGAFTVDATQTLLQGLRHVLA